jgi:hypothetical protein
MNNSAYCSPLTVKLTKELRLDSVYSINDSTGLDISGCEYADLVKLEMILSAPTHPEYEQISLIKNSEFLDIVRKITKDSNLSVLLLYICTNSLLIIIDDRELLLSIDA